MFVIFMKSVPRKLAICADVLSEVEFFVYLNAPQTTTLFFFKLSLISFIDFGKTLLASFSPNNFMTNSALVLVAKIPAIDSSFFDLPCFSKTEIYFLAIAPPPQTTTNLYLE